MDKKRLIGLLLGVILVLGGVGLFYFKGTEKPKEEQREATADSLEFKKQYESLNGKKNASDKDYLNVSIADNNPVQIKSDEEILEVLESGTGVIYFGFNSCPWCRSLVETLLKSVDDNKINNLYYVDVLDIRSSYEVEKKKLVNVKEGTTAYYKILEYLEDYLSDYKITSGKKEYDTKEKRLYAPTVVAIKDGNIVGFHEGTVDSQTDPYLGLSKDEKKELEEIFKTVFNGLIDDSCKEVGC